MVKARTRRPWTDGEKRLLAVLWQRGTLVKIIMHETGHSRSAVLKMRSDMELVPRKSKKHRKPHPICFYVNDAHMRIIARRSASLGVARSNYIRRLIEIDGGGGS